MLGLVLCSYATVIVFIQRADRKGCSAPPSFSEGCLLFSQRRMKDPVFRDLQISQVMGWELAGPFLLWGGKIGRAHV